MESLITILIPTRNEERFIRPCLESVRAFDLPAGTEIEMIVLDGRSSDRTRGIVDELAAIDPRITCIDNPGRIQSCAMNLGIRHAHGDWIMRLDAHSCYPTDYLRLCSKTAQRSKADNVGGLFITQPGGPGYSAQLVQALTTHKFGVGDSGFRTGAKEDWADTVPYGFFRREVFNRVGWFDERLVRAQDYEFNRRIIAMGGHILRNPQIQIDYFNQPTLRAFFRKQFVHEAPYNAYLWYVAPYAFAPRHAITAVFALGVLGGLALSPLTRWIAWPFAAVMGLYGLLALGAAVQQAVRYRRAVHTFCLPPLFFAYHFLHGIGVLWGLIRLATGTAPVQQLREPWPGAGFLRIRPVRAKPVPGVTQSGAGR